MSPILAVAAAACAVLSSAVLALNNQVRFQSRPSAVPDIEYADHRLIRVDAAVAPTAPYLAELDVWGRAEDGQLEVFVSRDELQLIESKQLFNYTVADVDVQSLVEQERARIAQVTSTAAGTADWFTDYHRYDDIVAWYNDLSEKHSTLLTFIPSIGRTHEGRDIFAVKISSPVGDRATKKQIWFQGQIHAREWISGATVQYVTNSLLAGYGRDDAVTALLDAVEYIIVPCMNPDGYEYTWTGSRLWRKNRRVNDGMFAGHGVDLNRNYAVQWDNSQGASRSPSSETYKGPSAASEPEVQALTAFFLKHPRIVGAIDFHSYSQLILRPLGYTSKPAEHAADLQRVGDKMQSIIASVSGKVYRSMTSYQLYPTSGSACDWFYGDTVAAAFKHHVYAYTIELRPQNSFGGQGFMLPPSEIIPTGKEIVPAVLYFSQQVLDKPLS